jgi:hypothetical protein
LTAENGNMPPDARMSLPELPPVSYWRSPRPSNAGVLYDTRRDAVANGEQVCEDLYTPDQMRAFYAEGVRAGMEQAAVIAEGFATDADNIVTAGAWDNAINTCAAAIGAAAKQGGQG